MVLAIDIIETIMITTEPITLEEVIIMVEIKTLEHQPTKTQILVGTLNLLLLKIK